VGTFSFVSLVASTYFLVQAVALRQPLLFYIRSVAPPASAKKIGRLMFWISTSAVFMMLNAFGLGGGIVTVAMSDFWISSQAQPQRHYVLVYFVASFGRIMVSFAQVKAVASDRGTSVARFNLSWCRKQLFNQVLPSSFSSFSTGPAWMFASTASAVELKLLTRTLDICSQLKAFGVSASDKTYWPSLAVACSEMNAHLQLSPQRVVSSNALIAGNWKVIGTTNSALVDSNESTYVEEDVYPSTSERTLSFHYTPSSIGGHEANGGIVRMVEVIESKTSHLSAQEPTRSTNELTGTYTWSSPSILEQHFFMACLGDVKVTVDSTKSTMEFSWPSASDAYLIGFKRESAPTAPLLNAEPVAPDEQTRGSWFVFQKCLDFESGAVQFQY
jgi:hypothetical protein